jgi:hypothetical protein
MSEISDAFHRKAEACRRLADLSQDDERKMLWIERATEWDRIAVKATKQRRLGEQI